MDVKGSVALVTGSNRGIGREYVTQLVARGAARVYATARDTASLDGLSPAVVPLPLDVTDPAQVAAVAERCKDVQLVVNNAGVNRFAGVFAAPDVTDAELEMRTNYFGPLRVSRAFAPALAANGGGAIVNLVSIMAVAAIPACGSASASKAAALTLTRCLRAELAAQGTRVLAVLPGAVDTDMSRGYPGDKMSAADVVTATLDGLERGVDEIYPGEMARSVQQGLLADPAQVERQFAQFLPF